MTKKTTINKYDNDNNHYKYNLLNITTIKRTD